MSKKWGHKNAKDDTKSLTPSRHVDTVYRAIYLTLYGTRSISTSTAQLEPIFRRHHVCTQNVKRRKLVSNMVKSLSFVMV